MLYNFGVRVLAFLDSVLEKSTVYSILLVVRERIEIASKIIIIKI